MNTPQTQVTLKRFPSVQDIASETGLCGGFWRKQIREGSLPVHRFGRRVVISREDFERWVSDRKFEVGA